MRTPGTLIGLVAVLALLAAAPALGGDVAHDIHGARRQHHPPPEGAPGSAHDLRVRSARILELFDTLIAPKAMQVITGLLSVDHILDATVQGRVTPVGVFHDREGVNEYFYGLASTPASPVVAVAFRSLVASGGKVAAEVDITFDRPARPPAERFQQIRVTGFFTFNRHNRVVSFDLAILNLGAALTPTTDAERTQNITSICALLTLGFPGRPSTCPGTFSSEPSPQVQFGACLAFMQSIPYGTWDRANSNTFVCRHLHALMTPFRPDVHCPHASPGGGGTCIDFTYGSFFEQEF
jgi:hypothetical protein